MIDEFQSPHRRGGFSDIASTLSNTSGESWFQSPHRRGGFSDGRPDWPVRPLPAVSIPASPGRLL